MLRQFNFSIAMTDYSLPLIIIIKHGLANLRVGQLREIGNGAIFNSMIFVRLVKMGQKSHAFLSSHPNGPILVGQLRESHTKWVRVGKD